MNIATKTIFIFEFISLQLCYGLLRYREKKSLLSNSVFGCICILQTLIGIYNTIKTRAEN